MLKNMCMERIAARKRLDGNNIWTIENIQNKSIKLIDTKATKNV